MKPKRTIILNLTVLLTGTLNALAQSGGSYKLNWHTIDGGGGRCAGGAFAIHGTIGQPESGGELRSDLPTLAGTFDSSESGALVEPVFALRGGFWAGIVQEEVGPRLHVDFDIGRVILAWPFPSRNYVLQQSANLGAPNGGWATIPIAPIPVGTNWQISFRATNSARLYRLIKQ
ncbi:MAG: hypothetical protein L0Y58_18465 [Verrucomicrobia subdivision 3 bacterium]|nr:hypothetical protein [Limisphaerales bacterium]